MLQIVRQQKRSERLLERAVTMPASPYRDGMIEEAFAGLDELEAYALPDQPYSMMVRVLLNTHRQELAVRFQDLLAEMPAPVAAPA
ncbi:hypothetical protein A9P79_01255 [Cupriavidus taiwanensis]|nr:hypothetical protein A9P79_01255 [Cupriavidus taiwanensis]